MLQYLRRLESLNMLHLVARRGESEAFKFGNGGRLWSQAHYRIPMCFGDACLFIWVSVAPCSALTLLVGKDVLAGLACKCEFMAKQLDVPLLA
eukprot:12468421-Alexandrium_andersonii.AAC.1